MSDTPPATSKTYTIAEATRLKGVHPNTVRKYIRRGRIKAEMLQGPYGVEYAIPETELDSLGVPMVDTIESVSLTDSGSLTPHPNTLTPLIWMALTELRESHQRELAAKDQVIEVLRTEIQELRARIALLEAPKTDDPHAYGQDSGVEPPQRSRWWMFWKWGGQPAYFVTE